MIPIPVTPIYHSMSCETTFGPTTSTHQRQTNKSTRLDGGHTILILATAIGDLILATAIGDLILATAIGDLILATAIGQHLPYRPYRTAPPGCKAVLLP